MNKTQLKKNVGSRIRMRPVAKRFLGGPTGLQLPPVDDDWSIQSVDKTGIRISNNATMHGVILGYDHVREFMTDPVRGSGYGVLVLKSQLHIGGDFLWVEPITASMPLVEPFQNVRGWQREDDEEYIRSWFPSQDLQSRTLKSGGEVSAQQFILLASLCVGVGLLAASF